MAERSQRRSRWRWAGIAAVVLFLAAVARFWHPVYGFTEFFQLDASNDDLKISEFRNLPVYVYRDTGGYDGLYYAQIAIDPSLRDPELPRAMDNLSYRARRILPSALAWIAGAGRPAAVITAYSLINVVAWLLLAVLLWRVLRVRELRGFIAWAGVMFSAGALVSVRLALTDLIALTLTTAMLAAAERGRKITALGCAAAAALSRETSILAVAGLTKRPWISWKNAVRVVAAALPLAAWLAYVRFRVGPADQGWGNLTWPVWGFIRKWAAAVEAPFHLDDPWLAWTSLLALGGLTVQAAFILARPRWSDRWWRVGAAFVVLMAFCGTAVWEGFPGAVFRVLLPLTLAFNVLAARERASLWWLLIGNLTVFAGGLTLVHVPSDPTELTAGRWGNTAGIVHEGPGWYDREQASGHRWMWARQDGSVTLEAWPKADARIRIVFGLRSLDARTVLLRQDGHEIWRGPADSMRAVHQVDIDVKGGRAVLDFSTTTPPVPEPGGSPRQLAFALYDLRFAVPER